MILRTLLIAATFCALACGPQSAPAGPPQNLLVVTMDSVRADRFETPERFSELPFALAAFQEEALHFEGISNAPATLPAVASLFTGRLPRELGYPAPNRKLPAAHPTLAELFARKGYDTAAFVTTSALAGPTGIERGFALFSTPDDYRVEDYEVTQAARKWLSRPEREQNPWFLWVHLNAGHGPYRALETAFNPLNFFHKSAIPTPRGRDRKLKKASGPSGGAGLPEYQRLPGPALFGRYREAYDARVRVGDWFANELRHVLKHTEQYDSTAFAVIGTHGESLGEHGVEFDHGTQLYPEVLEIPYLLRIPGHAASKDSGRASQLDFTPTMVALFQLPTAAALDSSLGRNLLSAPPTSNSTRAIFSETYPPFSEASLTSIRNTHWSLIRTGQAEPLASNLTEDVDQPNPSAPAQSSLQSQLEQFEALSIPPPPTIKLTNQALSRLRALGYTVSRFE